MRIPRCSYPILPCSLPKSRRALSGPLTRYHLWQLDRLLKLLPLEAAKDGRKLLPGGKR